MKKSILIISILAMAYLTNAQGNLQFNQVKRLNYTGTAGAYSATTIGSITVPAGKVWKIESGSLFANVFYVITSFSLSVDSQMLWSSGFAAQPIWLGPGTYPIQIMSNNSAEPYTAAISGIEYNVIP